MNDQQQFRRPWSGPRAATDYKSGEWIHKIADEMSQLAAAFEVTGPRAIPVAVGDGVVLLASGNVQRFGLLLWPCISPEAEIQPNIKLFVDSGIKLGPIGTPTYFDYRKHGLLVGVPWYARNLIDAAGTIAVVEILMT